MKNLFFCFLAMMTLMTIGCGDPCDDVDCGTGTCIDGTCECPDGFSGVNCEIQDLCFNVDCGDGTCVDGTCECPDGFTGVNCEIQDLCFNVDCGNGTCDDATGDCICDEGYEGDNCEVAIRDKFIGSWNSTDFSCDGDSPQSVLLVIEAGVGILEVLVIDPSEPAVSLVSVIDGDTFTVAAQTVTLSNGLAVTISGDGSLENGVLTLHILQEIPGFGTADCTGTFTM